MTLAYYFDDNITTKPVLAALRVQGVHALASDDAGKRGVADSEHLLFAASQGMVLVTADKADFYALHASWMRDNRSHSGIVIVRQMTSIGDQLRGLLRLSTERSPEAMENEVVFLSRLI